MLLEAGINHIKLSPLDHSSFKFISDKVRGADDRGQGGGGRDATEDVVYGLLEGRLAGSGTADPRWSRGTTSRAVARVARPPCDARLMLPHSRSIEPQVSACATLRVLIHGSFLGHLCDLPAASGQVSARGSAIGE